MSCPEPGRLLIGKRHCFDPARVGLLLETRRGIGKELLERALNCLEYLAQLRECGYDPVFKGGTAVQLLVPDPLQRLSIDLDFASVIDESGLLEIMNRASQRFGNGLYRHDRTGQGLPRHLLLYNVYIPSVLTTTPAKIALDILLHDPAYKTRRVPIKTFFYESETTVQVPTVEALLGDKLSVLAHGTIGKDLHSSALGYAKQLFDLHALLEISVNIEDVFDAFVHVFHFERGARHQPAMSLTKVLDSIHVICQSCALTEHVPGWLKDPSILRIKNTLKGGVDGLTQYTSSKMKLTHSHASVVGSKLACLCKLMLEREKGARCSFPALSVFHSDNPRLQEMVKDKDVLEQFIEDFRRIKKEAVYYFDPVILKKINPTALVFWHAAFFSESINDLIR